MDNTTLEDYRHWLAKTEVEVATLTGKVEEYRRIISAEEKRRSDKAKKQKTPAQA